MSLVLYELCGARREQVFSPFSWRAKMALKHKGLAFETRPCVFMEIPKVAPEAGRTVPILVDGDTTVCDSWAIAEYLETTYPDRPSLFGGDGGRAASKLIEGWANATLSTLVAQMIVKDVYDVLDPQDRDYFRESREKRFGRSLDEVQSGREERLADLKTALLPFHLMLREQPFIGGDRPLYGDYMVFGTFQWARVASAFQLLEPDTPVGQWFDRCLNLFDGYGHATRAA